MLAVFPAALLLKHLPQLAEQAGPLSAPGVGLQDLWLKILSPDGRYLLSKSPRRRATLSFCVCLHFHHNTGLKVRFGHCVVVCIHTGLLPWAEVKSGHTGEHSAEGKLGWHWQSICELVKAGSCQVWRSSTYNPSNCSNKAGGLPLVWRQPTVVKGLMWVLETELNPLPEQCGFSSH